MTRRWVCLGLMTLTACTEKGSTSVPTDGDVDTDLVAGVDHGGGGGGGGGGSGGGGGGGGGATDTDVVDTGGGSTLPTSWTHVVDSMALLPSGQGFDVDGDGHIDNALGAFQPALGNLLTQAIRAASTVEIYQTWGVNDGNNRVELGLLFGDDLDASPNDNFNGHEAFEVSNGLLPSGKALFTLPTTLGARGAFSGQLPVGAFMVVGVALPTVEPQFVSGNVTATAFSGRMGTALSAQQLADALTNAGLGLIAPAILAAADVDTNRDGTNDAVSLAVSVTGVPCTIAP